jgi:hypothetical protein
MMWETFSLCPGATIRTDYTLLVVGAIVVLTILGVFWARR